MTTMHLSCQIPTNELDQPKHMYLLYATLKSRMTVEYKSASGKW